MDSSAHNTMETGRDKHWSYESLDSGKDLLKQKD